jgi:hypothetical protein
MALTAQQRTNLRASWATLISERREAFPLSKTQLDAAIAAVDDWIDANAVSYNNALPVAARSGLTTAQKAELLHLVALKRFRG